jgi:hypothetical protein
MASVRIRWRGVARAAAIVVVGLLALRVVPGLLRAPEPPPLGRDVGLPRASAAPVKPVRAVTKPKPREKKKTRVLPDRAASVAVIGAHHRHRVRRHRRGTMPGPEPVESTAPAVPEYVPPPPPETPPAAAPELPAAPPPASSTTPGDGSQEFAPH